jgi:hypothetical protein
MHINSLLKLADQYHRRAIVAQQNQNTQYSNSIIKSMIGLANGAAVSVQHLLSNPQYTHSAGLSAIKQKMPEIAQKLSSFNPTASGEAFIQSLGTILDGLSFYTSKGNGGTGYDPITAVSAGGYTAPAYYVDNLLQLTEKLKGAVQYQAHSPWEPTSSDAMAKDLSRQEHQQVRKV